MRTSPALLALFCAAATQAAEPITAQAPDFQCTGKPLSVRLPERLSQVRKVGALRKQEIVRTEDWDGYKATELALHFPGLSVGVVTFSNDPERYNLSAVRIHGAAWDLSPFKVGQPAAPALARLGAELSSSNGSWRFAGESDSLLLVVKDHRILEVIYECYTG